MEVQPYYASQRRFTLATGWLLPGNLGGIADRLLLARSETHAVPISTTAIAAEQSFIAGKRQTVPDPFLPVAIF